MIKKIIYSILLLMLPFASTVFGQDTSNTAIDSLRFEELMVIDSVSYLTLSKTSDSLNGYLNDSLFGFIDTAKINPYPFIQLNHNHFQFYTKNSPSFERLFFEMQEMVRNKDRKLNFYHIGGSHVQADIYSNIIREYLQTYWEDLPGERGIVFPYKMAKTNNPWNYSFTSNNEWTGYRSVVTRPDSIHYGIMGVAIAGKDSILNLAFDYKNTEVKTPIDHIRIYHNKGKLPYTIYYDSVKTPVLLQYTNESLGFTDTYFKDETTSFEVFFERISDSLFFELEGVDSTSDQSLYIYGLQLMNKRPGISYTTIGVNGAGLYTYRDNENFLEQLSQAPPNLMIFSVGTNDANVPYDNFKPEEFEGNLEYMMKLVLTANPKCAILLTVPNDSYYKRRYLNKNIDREREVIVKLAKKYQIPVWDLYGMMGELGSSKTWQVNKLMKADLVHFTVEGYYLKGELFFEAFLKWIEQMELRPQMSLLKKD